MRVTSTFDPIIRTVARGICWIHLSDCTFVSACTSVSVCSVLQHLHFRGMGTAQSKPKGESTSVTANDTTLGDGDAQKAVTVDHGTGAEESSPNIAVSECPPASSASPTQPISDTSRAGSGERGRGWRRFDRRGGGGRGGVRPSRQGAPPSNETLPSRDFDQNSDVATPEFGSKAVDGPAAASCTDHTDDGDKAGSCSDAKMERERDHALVLDLMEFFCFAVKVMFGRVLVLCSFETVDVIALLARVNARTTKTFAAVPNNPNPCHLSPRLSIRNLKSSAGSKIVSHNRTVNVAPCLLIAIVSKTN